LHFRIAHDFEIPRDALELAFLSPDLMSKLHQRLNGMRAVQRKHELRDGVLERVWLYKANVRLHSRYNLADHESTWEVERKGRSWFSAKGTYQLVAVGEANTQRVVEGDVELKVPVVSKVAERMILAQVKKAFETEAETLRDMATLV
jgi:hypothetical protein